MNFETFFEDTKVAIFSLLLGIKEKTIFSTDPTFEQLAHYFFAH
jgi:hypothetical protein